MYRYMQVHVYTHWGIICVNMISWCSACMQCEARGASVGHYSYVQIYGCPMQCEARVPSVGHYEQELPGTQSSPGGGYCGRVTAVPLHLSTSDKTREQLVYDSTPFSESTVWKSYITYYTIWAKYLWQYFHQARFMHIVTVKQHVFIQIKLKHITQCLPPP